MTIEQVTTWAFDNLNRVTQITQPDPDGAGALTSPVTKFAFDALSRRTSLTDPDNNVREAGHVQFDDHAVMHEAIDGRCRGHCILEDLVPFAEGKVVRQQHAPSFVAFRQKCEQH